MKILLIGGTGNISQACGQLMHDRGHQLTLLNRGKNEAAFPCEVIQADRNAPGALKKVLEGRSFDVIADFICFDEKEAALAFEACRGRCGQYILISTTVVYEKPPRLLPVTESSPIGNRFSEYGRKKEAAERFLLDKFEQQKFPLTIIRPSHTYSERWLPNPVTSVGYTLAARMEKGLPVFVHDDGQGLWTLTHVRDFAVGFAGLCGAPGSLGEAYQITSDMVLTWNQILKEIADALGITSPKIVKIPTDFICEVDPAMSDKLRGDKACHAVFDCSKLKAIVPDFDCKITFRQGIRESIAWFKADTARQTVNQEHDQVFSNIVNAWKNKVG